MLQRQRAPFSLAPAFLGTGFPFSTPRSPWPPKLSRNHPASLPRIPRQPHPNDQKATPRPTTPPHTPKKEPQNKGHTHNQLFWGMYFFPHGMLCFPGPGEIEEIWGMYSAAPVGFVQGSSAPVSKYEIWGITWALFCPHCFCHPGAEHKPSRVAPGIG